MENNEILLDKYPLPADLLPHQPPILFVDRILEFKPNQYLIAEKMVLEDCPFFEGHFPGYPILPGVILTEALFQTCSLYNRLEPMNTPLKNSAPQNKNASGRAIKIDNFVFKEEIKPITLITLKAEFEKRVMRFSVFNCSIIANGKLVAKGQLTTFILDK